jgi:FAD/FMN-containing dehydrogenase
VKGWRDYMRSAPAALTTSLLLMPAKAIGENPPLCIVLCCWDGDDEAEAKAALDPLRKLGKILNDGVAKKHYYEALEEAHQPKGLHVEVNNALFPDLNDTVIDQLLTGYNDDKLMLQIRSIGGALNKIAADGTAFAHRDSEAMVICPRFFPPDANETQIQEALKPWRKIAALGSGAYANFFSRATEQEVNTVYPPATYQKLATIKRQYDPQNLFNQNLNIKPAN